VAKKMFGKIYSVLKKSSRLDQAILLKHYMGAVLSSSGGYMDVRH
jgi:hypothetical protein